jgi:hypothetical protein
MAKSKLHCDNWHVSIMFSVWNLSFLYWLLKVIVGSLNRTGKRTITEHPVFSPFCNKVLQL